MRVPSSQAGPPRITRPEIPKPDAEPIETDGLALARGSVGALVQQRAHGSTGTQGAILLSRVYLKF